MVKKKKKKKVKTLDQLFMKSMHKILTSIIKLTDEKLGEHSCNQSGTRKDITAINPCPYHGWCSSECNSHQKEIKDILIGRVSTDGMVITKI